MPVEIEFSEDRHCIIYTITDPLEMSDLFEAYEREKGFRDSVSHTVHSITDMSQLKRIPPNWLTSKAGPGLKHPRSGEMLFVGLSPGFKILLQTIMKIMRFDRMKVFDTRAEADAHLATLIAEDNVSSDN